MILPATHATIFLSAWTSAYRQKRCFSSTVLCAFAFCPKKAKSNSEARRKWVCWKTKFTKGKCRNEGKLFPEPISKDKRKAHGRNDFFAGIAHREKYDLKTADKIYIGLIKDLHHMEEIDYIVSDG